jgi:hypothetical protein
MELEQVQVGGSNMNSCEGIRNEFVPCITVLYTETDSHYS